MTPSGLETSLRDLLIIVFKRKWSLLAIFLVTVLSSGFYLFVMCDDVYKATAKVLVRLGQEQAVPPTVLGDRPNIIVNRLQDVHSEVDILKSAQLLERAVDRLGLDKPGKKPKRPSGFVAGVRHDVKRQVWLVRKWINDSLISMGLRESLSRREVALLMLAGGIQIEPKPQSNVIEVNLFYPSRDNISFILNKFLDLYLDFRLKIHQDGGAVEFFEKQSQNSLKGLKRLQNQLYRFEAESNITNMAEQKSVFLKQIAQGEDRRRKAKIDLDLASSKAARLEREVGKPEPDFAMIGAFMPNSFPGTLQNELAVLQREREKLRMIELDNGVRIQNNREQFKAVMSLMVSHLQSVHGEKQQAYESQGASLEELKEELRRLHANEVRWKELVRELKVTEHDYLFNQEKLQQSLAIQALERQKVGNVTVIQRAIKPLGTVGVSKTTLLGVGVLFAVLAAGSWAAVAEYFDHGVYTPEMLERYLHAPVATVVPVHKGLTLGDDD